MYPSQLVCNPSDYTYGLQLIVCLYRYLLCIKLKIKNIITRINFVKKKKQYDIILVCIRVGFE